MLDLWSLVFHLQFDTIHKLVSESVSAFCYTFAIMPVLPSQLNK